MPRVLVLWCPDWPVVAASGAAGIPAHRPSAVVAANRVVACSAPARAHGVRRGLRRREAQARCPELIVLAADPERDARWFEQVTSAVEELAPGVEVVRPGLVALLARGPVGYFGSVREATERLIDHVAARVGAECQVGVADGLFAATLAAHRGLVVEAGRSAEFLSSLEVGELDREPVAGRSELINLLRRLGLRNLGAFAALPTVEVASRFGSDAVLAHRLARGRDPRPPMRRRVSKDLAVEVALDPPVTSVDTAAFASRALVEQLHSLLADHGLACTRLGIQARTVGGRELARVWRCAEPLVPAGTADRVRWQLDAWLTRQLISRGRSTGESGLDGVDGVDGVDGIGALRLSGEEVVVAGTLQMGLWGDVGQAQARADRALARVQALLGPEGVYTATLEGGRGSSERVRLVPWGDERGDERGARAGDPEPPWPGRLPAPSPSIVPTGLLPAEVSGVTGRPVVVTDRHALSAVPATVRVDGRDSRQVRAWAGPWPVDQRWWDAALEWRGVRLQVVLAGTGGEDAGEGGSIADADVETALLLFCDTENRWSVLGGYD